MLTIKEFKAWLEGFSLSFNDKAPTVNQWKEILEKIKLIEEYVHVRTVGVPMPYPVYPTTMLNYPFSPNYTPIIYSTTLTNGTTT